MCPLFIISGIWNVVKYCFIFQVRKEKLRSDILKAYLKHSIVFKGPVKVLHTYFWGLGSSFDTCYRTLKDYANEEGMKHPMGQHNLNNLCR